jgi:hypothetical protein
VHAGIIFATSPTNLLHIEFISSIALHCTARFRYRLMSVKIRAHQSEWTSVNLTAVCMSCKRATQQKITLPTHMAHCFGFWSGQMRPSKMQGKSDCARQLWAFFFFFNWSCGLTTANRNQTVVCWHVVPGPTEQSSQMRGD